MLSQRFSSKCSIVIMFFALGASLASGCKQPTGAALKALSITPEHASVSVGSTQTFKVTGTFDDGTTEDVTSSVLFTSSDVTLAAPSTDTAIFGAFVGVKAGTVTITAADTSLQAAAQLTITSAMCSTQTQVQAEPLPLDIYVMLSQAGGMANSASGSISKWQAVTTGMNAFLAQSSLNAVSVGIQYFGLPLPAPTTCATDSDCGVAGPCFQNLCIGNPPESCTATDYAAADVEIAPLPGVASAINSSLAAHSPVASTTTAPALQGAISHAKAWATSHPGHTPIVVFAADGNPSACDTNIAQINAIAADGANGTPKVLTYVVEIGSSISSLDGIAAAGGTTSAHTVALGTGTANATLGALNQISAAARTCSYKIPAGVLDFAALNVQFDPGTGAPVQLIKQVADKAHCTSSGGWSYNDPTSPSQIDLCDNTALCGSAASVGQVSILTGCATVH